MAAGRCPVFGDPAGQEKPLPGTGPGRAPRCFGALVEVSPSSLSPQHPSMWLPRGFLIPSTAFGCCRFLFLLIPHLSQANPGLAGKPDVQNDGHGAVLAEPRGHRGEGRVISPKSFSSCGVGTWVPRMEQPRGHPRCWRPRRLLSSSEAAGGRCTTPGTPIQDGVSVVVSAPVLGKILQSQWSAGCARGSDN